MNVDRMLEDLPSLRAGTERQLNAAIQSSLDQAAAEGISEPVTYPFVSEWTPTTASKSESENWYYATGGYHYTTAGTVTVYPPSEPGGEFTYSYAYRVHTADRYNWDRGKGVNISGQSVPDTELQRLHEVGLAQEYDLRGESRVYTGP